MTRNVFCSAGLLSALLLSGVLHGQQTPDPTKPPTDAWPTYHGDYKATHFSPLKEITTTNVRNLSLAWRYRTNGSPVGAILAGEGPNPAPAPAAPVGRGGGAGAVGGGTIKGIPLMVNGILYLATTNNVYAIDARSGAEIWHFYWKSTGGTSGTRGVSMLGNTLFFQTGDEFVVALDATTGEERWRKRVVSGPGYTNATTPLAIKNHVILGVGGDRQDIPAWVESRHPDTGELQWKWNVTPRKGEPGIETWPSEDAAIHGGGGAWQPFTYDAELNNVIVTTANPNPVLNGLGRPGANLYTSSIVALNAETGKMQWYFQCSPHDVRDWDATQTVMLFEGVIEGKPRKLAAQFCRPGWLFILDRTTGKAVISKPFITTSNVFIGTDEKGQPISDPAKDPSFAGVLTSPDTDGASNYPAPSFNPDLGLLYVNATEAFSIFYLTTNDTKSIAWGGASEHHVGIFPSALRAFDYKTGNMKWEHKYEGNGFWSSSHPGILTTGGGVLFTGDPAGNFRAFDAANGKSLWHFPLGVLQSNAPNTFTLDGRQYVLVAGGDTLYAFYLQ